MSNQVPTYNSLVKYSTPVLVSVAGQKTKQQDKGKDQKGEVDKKGNVGAAKETHRTQDILSEILPPKEHQLQNGQLWIQTVLSTPATRTDVLALQKELDNRLLQRQARETGICPIREDLYDECFDELIRQITIDCRERGLLLVRVRDQFRNQLNAYQTLYESSIAYGMRKMIDSEQKRTEMNNQILTLEKECQELQQYVDDLSEQINFTKNHETTKLENENENHKSEVQKIQQNNIRLKEELQSSLENSNQK